MTGQEIKKRLEARALELGFDRIGFTPAGPCRDAGHLERWLARSRHGEMAWMERDPARRCDPREVLPGARTVVSLLTFYGTEDDPAGACEAGRVSRYAWGDDYHNVLGRRLRKLVREIEDWVPGSRTVSAVDHRPVLEKEWAERAGLGWIGKHTNLITTDRGSWFFLSELLTDVDLPAAERAHPERCGKCGDCLDACPTGAIVAPFQVDARRCISYLTIELDGPIPLELRPLVGEWIFGCDVCQEVCPWNKFATPVNEPRFHRSRARFHGDVASFLALSDEEFRRRFEGSPVRRAGREGFLRNVCVALGNRRDPDSVAPLTRALADDSALVRGHAAWALGRIRNEAACAALRTRLEVESEPTVLDEIRAALDTENAPPAA